MRALIAVLSGSLCHGHHIAIKRDLCIAQLKKLTSSPQSLHTTSVHQILTTEPLPASAWLPFMSVLLLQRDISYVLIASELLAKLHQMTGRAAVQCSLLEAALAILTTADSWLPVSTYTTAVAQVCGV